MKFLKELMLTIQANQKSVIFVAIDIFQNKGFNFRPHDCSGCSDLIMMSLSLSNIAILNISSADYCCIINGISKNEAINLPENNDLNEKIGTL